MCETDYVAENGCATLHFTNSDGFFYVFTIIFQAFTKQAAGLGLSADLREPEKSIPRETIWATIIGLLIYIAVAFKLSVSASTEDLASNQFIMQKLHSKNQLFPLFGRDFIKYGTRFHHDYASYATSGGFRSYFSKYPF